MQSKTAEPAYYAVISLADTEVWELNSKLGPCVYCTSNCIVKFSLNP